jgi:ubiquinone biosynthesis protein UbiJ
MSNDTPDVTAREALTVAQRALAKCVELEDVLDDVHDLKADVRQLESVVAELEGEDE